MADSRKGRNVYKKPVPGEKEVAQTIGAHQRPQEPAPSSPSHNWVYLNLKIKDNTKWIMIHQIIKML